MNDCLFCKIIKKEIPSKKVFEDENVYAFEDIHPMAKIHNLFIHKKHTQDVNSLMTSDSAQISDVFNAIKTWTNSQDLQKSGFRVVTNCGPNAGQTVFHTHFHVLGGEKLGRFGS